MTKYIVAGVALTLIVGLRSYAQSECNCTEVLGQLIEKVEHEYPGFEDLVKDQRAYEGFKRSLIESALDPTSGDCLDILQEYLEYFKNPGHLAIGRRDTGPKAPREDGGGVLRIDLGEFPGYLEKSADRLEGIWSSEDYKVGIVQQNGDHVAFIIDAKNKSWQPSDVKFRLGPDGKAIYYLGDHSREDDSYTLHEDCILYFDGLKLAFVREIPPPRISKEMLAAALEEIEGFLVRPLSERTVLLRISSFGYAYVDRIRELVEQNAALLHDHDCLIIDLRGNSGGTNNAYRPLLPYLYTNPVRHLSGEYLVTETLIASLKNWANSADKTEEADEIESVRRDLQRMEGRIGEFVPYSTGELFGYSRLDSVAANPKHVVVLVDKSCGSATEMFLMAAKQSKKVKVLGTPTYGAIDYLSVIEFALECQDYSLHMPTVRGIRVSDYPIDTIGIQPDIFMDKYIPDWIEYAREYLEN